MLDDSDFGRAWVEMHEWPVWETTFTGIDENGQPATETLWGTQHPVMGRTYETDLCEFETEDECYAWIGYNTRPIEVT